METTEGIEVIAEGHYKFTLREPVTKKIVGENKKLYVWRFKAIDGIKATNHTERLLSFQCGPLLEAYGIKKDEEGKYKWELDQFFGEDQIIEGDIVHEQDRKDPNKKWPRIKNPVRCIGF